MKTKLEMAKTMCEKINQNPVQLDGMGQFQKLAEACQRIFKNGTVLRNEVVLINMDKIFELPVISDQFDIQRCTFLTCDDGSDVWKREIIDNGKAFYILH